MTGISTFSWCVKTASDFFRRWNVLHGISRAPIIDDKTINLRTTSKHSLLDILQPSMLFRSLKNWTNDSNFANNNTYKDLSIYHDEHKFFTQPIYQSIHHSLNFDFLTSMVVIDAHLMYISSSTLTRCLLVLKC